MSKTLAQKARFYHQLYVGYKAGLPLEMLVLGAQLPAGTTQHSERLHCDIQQGKALSSALLARKLISAWEAKLLKIGEDSGRLEYILQDLESFYEDRNQQMRATRARLLYPIIIIIFAILIPPLPQLVDGTLSLFAYTLLSGTKLFILYLLYQLLIVKPFVKASNGAFNPILLFSLKYVGANHFLRELFEVSYLNLLSMCLESGLDALESLKLLKEGTSNKRFRQLHQQAIRNIGIHGFCLSKVLSTLGILQNHEVISFLSASEQSGSMHSDLRKFLARKNTELSLRMNFVVKQCCQWFYVSLLILLASGFVL